MEHKVAVVILNWNGLKLLEEFIPSVLKTIPSYVKLIIADNASTDNSIDFIQTNFPEIEIVINDKNYGFAEGYNIALKKVNAEYLVLLNSDVETKENWIEPIVNFMNLNPKVGACQPKILDYKNKLHFEYAGASGGFIDQLGFPFCRGRIFNELESDQNQYNQAIPIFWATGACLFIRKKVFDDLNGFDTDFFAHMEEIDLCWRIQRLGLDIYCIPESTVFHLGGGTLKKINPQKTFLNFRNNLVMIIKNSPPNLFWRRIFLKLVLDGIAGLKFLAEGSPMHSLSILKAHFYIYKNFASIWKKRQDLKKQMGYPKIKTLYRKSIVASYYALGKKKFSELTFE